MYAPAKKAAAFFQECVLYLELADASYNLAYSRTRVLAALGLRVRLARELVLLQELRAARQARAEVANGQRCRKSI